MKSVESAAAGRGTWAALGRPAGPGRRGRGLCGGRPGVVRTL